MCSKLYADGELAATPYETDKVLRHRELCMGLNVLYAKKNHDYGDSFHQTYIEEGMAMPRIRLGDKFSRFKTLSRILSSDSDQQAVTDESIRDTLLDLANYSMNKRLAMRGQVMQIKKAGGKIFGASLTAAEQKAMNMEIQRQLVEYDRKNELELDAIILWELHTQLGLGPKRLKKFFDGFSDALNALVNRYEMDISDDVWLCTHKLKEIGVDVEDWYRQKE